MSIKSKKDNNKFMNKMSKKLKLNNKKVIKICDEQNYDWVLVCSTCEMKNGCSHMNRRHISFCVLHNCELLEKNGKKVCPEQLWMKAN